VQRPVRPRPGHAGTQVAPGVVRLGDRVVNYYLVEHPDGLVLVDAGLPAHRAQLDEWLAAGGRTTTDIRAVLLTHAHPDHTGLAGPLQRAGAQVWVHERDAAILSDGPRSATRHARPERPMLRYLLRRPAAVGTLVHLARRGAFTAPPVGGARTFTSDQWLDDVPGRPQAVALGGHTPGSSGFLFPAAGLLFTGDALVTLDGLTGHAGPTLVCRAFTHDSAAALGALDRIAGLPAGTLLPGHGDPMDSPPEAVREARRTGPS
jgi:glyoxylase-like metal-dependent hydrolase (beta-lactamase superfamily II)